MRKVTWWQIPTVLWLGGGTTSYFSQLFNVHGVKDVRQAEKHTAEPLVSEPSASEIELAIDKLKSHKSPGIDQIPAELIKAGGRTIFLEIHKLITSIWKKRKLPEERKESIIVPIHKTGNKRDCTGLVIIIEAYHFCQPLTKFYPTSCSQGSFHMRKKLSGIIIVAFDATGRLLIIYSAFATYLRKNGNTTKKLISSL